MRVSVVLLLAALAACARTPVTTAAVPAAPIPIDVSELRRDVFAFAADSFMGRETGTTAASKAARFLADRLVALGLEPAGDSLYTQRVPLVRTTFGAGTRFNVTEGQTTSGIALGPDIVPLINLGAGAPLPRRNAEGEMVFAGYGLNSMGREDFKPATQPGKVIVMLHAAPPGVTDTATRQRLESQEELGNRLMRALQLRPAAIILVMTGPTSEFYSQAAPELMRSVTAAPGDQSTSDAERPLPMVLIANARAGSPLLPRGWPNDDTPQVLAGRRFSARVEVRNEPFVAHNVLGVVRGTDPRLNRTYVAYGAHYDHIGVQPGMAPDSIANGADDDASGSMTLLAIAKSMMGTRPRRSVLFVWHTGEEKGLLGSAHFVDNPTIPIDSIVAHFNADMIGRRGGPTSDFNSILRGEEAADRLYIVGPMAAPNEQSKVLGAILDSVNARQLRPLQLDSEWDSPTHPERIYFRSDHFNYARKGIPILFFTTGLHEDYHKVSDEPDKIDYDKMARIGRLLLELGTTVGNREQRPR